MKLCAHKVRLLLRCFGVPVVMAGVAAASPGQDKTFIIATPGGPTPDGQDTMHGVSIFALSERGVVFRAKSVTSNLTSLYAVKRSGTTEILREGTVIPGVGTIEWMLGQIQTNLSVEAAVIVGIRNTSGVLKEAIVAGSSPQNLRVVAMEGQPLPGGIGQYSSFSVPNLNDLGQVGFSAPEGIFLANRDGTVVRVARGQDPAPGEPYHFSSLSGGSLSSLGHLYFSGNIADNYYGTGNTYGVYRRELSGSLTRLYRSRQPAPGTPWLFGNPGGVGQHYTGRYVIYSTLIDAAGTQSGWGIFTGTNEEDLLPVAVTGQAAPSSAGTYTTFDQQPTINLTGKVAYVGYCTGGTASSGLFTSHNGQQRLLYRAGQAAPGGNIFSGFAFPVINDNGTILFAARLNGGETLQGIYLTDGTDIIKIAQAGDTVGGRTIQSLGIDPKAFNSFNQLAYQATLSGGQSGSSLLLFAPRLRWRGVIGGIWEDAFNWTASLVPSEYNDVDIVPPDGIGIAGPVEDTTVAHLTVGTSGAGMTDFKLKSGVLTAISGVSIDEGGMLSGSGKIVGDLSNDSLVAPGNSPGTIAIEGNYSQSATGSLRVEISGGGAGEHDLLQIDGDVSLAGTLEVELADNAMDRLGLPVSIPVVVASGQVSGQFSNLPVGTRVQVAGGLASFEVAYGPHAVTLQDLQFLDSDSDGVPDYWMVEHFGATSGNEGNGSLAEGDADGDGSSNRDEYVAGTDPLNGTSSLVASAGAVTPEGVTIRFQSQAGRIYAIEFSDDLISWDEVRSGIAGDGSEKAVTLDRESPAAQGYYRVTAAR